MANNVRGPSSALTEYLREAGITATSIARRVRTQGAPAQQNEEGAQDAPDAENNVVAEQPQAGPSRSRRTRATSGYASDELDDPAEEAEPSTKKRKVMGKAATAKAKAAAKKKAMADGDYNSDDEDDEYTAPSTRKTAPKPQPGSFENCARCSKQFTVTKYTMAANPGPGYLCHQCAKQGGANPFKKPAAPVKREKRPLPVIEERRISSLVSHCVELISKHIDDVEALGDLGSANMEAIAKAICRNRTLSSENVMLFHDVNNKTLFLHDVTKLLPDSLITIANLNPNLHSLRLDYCGRINDDVLKSWAVSLPHLKRLELLGPFLVTPSGWKSFFEGHPSLEGFLINQSPRFDLACLQSLLSCCGATLNILRLKEVGKLDDDFLSEIAGKSGVAWKYLDLSSPSSSCSTEALVELIHEVGASLTHLDLSGHVEGVTDMFLSQALLPHAQALTSLSLSGCIELTDGGVSELFTGWKGAGAASNMQHLDLSRCHLLAGLALEALLLHCGPVLRTLNINGWRIVPQGSLAALPSSARSLETLDVSWCREVDDFFVKDVLNECSGGPGRGNGIREISLWGCNRLTAACPRKWGVSVGGVEAHSI